MQKTLAVVLKESLIAGGALLCFLALLLYVYTKAPAVPERAAVPPPIAQTPRPSANASLDTDGDGLPDFEEALWGTDPKNPDTDGDGTSDGAEVRAGRDPRKPGPNDVLASPVRKIEAASPISKEEDNPPAADGSAPFTKGENNPPAADASGAGVSPLVKGVPPSSEAGVVLPSNTTVESPLHAYGNAIGRLIMSASADMDAQHALWNRTAGRVKATPELLQALSELEKKYSELAANIASVIPPPSATAAHASLTTAYRNYAAAVRTIADTPLDAYFSGAAFTAYGAATVALGHAFADVSDLFYRERVTFGKDEPGNIFMFPR